MIEPNAAPSTPACAKCSALTSSLPCDQLSSICVCNISTAPSIAPVVAALRARIPIDRVGVRAAAVRAVDSNH